VLRLPGTLVPARNLKIPADPSPGMSIRGTRIRVAGDSLTCEEDNMKQYLLSVYHPEDSYPEPDVIEQIMRDVDAVNEEIRAAGAWVFAGGLYPSSTATVVQLKGNDVLTTDGPFAEGKEHVGGLWIIKAPDLDAALEWGRKATRACRIPVEVRPFQEDVEG
jgi:hypothetical protein